MRLSLLFLIFCFSNPLFARSLEGVQKNNRGVLLFSEDAFLAKESFLEALAKEPFDEQVKLNLGTSFEATEDYEKALKLYLAVAHSTNQEHLKHQAYFNAGSVSTQLDKTEQALMYYQKALEYRPNSKNTKINIELLTQQQEGESQKKQQENPKNSKKNQEKENSKENKPEENSPNKSEQRQTEENQKNQGQKEQENSSEFKGQKLTKDDVRRILEELKNQEQSIRAKEFQKGPKERAKAKDW